MSLTTDQKARSKKAGPDILKAYLPIIANDRTTNEDIQAFRKKQATKHKINITQVRSVCAYVKIDADKAIDAWKATHPNVKKDLKHTLIKLTAKLRKVPKARRLKLASVKKLAKELGVDTEAIIALVSDYEERLLKKHIQKKKQTRKITGSKKRGRPPKTPPPITLEDLNNIEPHNIPIARSALFFTVGTGSKLLDKAKKESPNIKKVPELIRFIIQTNSYGEYYDKATANLSPSLTRHLEKHNHIILGDMKVPSRSKQKVKREIDRLVKDGYLIQHPNIRHGIVYSLNPIAALYKATGYGDNDLSNITAKELSRLICMAADFSLKATSKVQI